MASLPSYKRIMKGDFPKQMQDVVSQLALIINSAFDSIFNALNKNLTLADNMYATINSVTVMVDSIGTPTTPTIFSIVTKGPIAGISVLSATNSTNNAIYPTGQPFISFTQSGSIITINNITGLVAGNTYILKLVAWGG